MAEQPLQPGKQYLLKQTSKSTLASISTLRYRVDVNTLHRQEAAVLNMNEVGRATVVVNQPLAFDPYRRNRATGAFILIDRLTNGTVGAGMIIDRESTGGALGHDYWSAEPQTQSEARQGSQVTAEQPSGAVQSEADDAVAHRFDRRGQNDDRLRARERRLFDTGHAVSVLDGERMRHGISKDLGFTASERSENLRRSVEVAKLMNDAGLICVCAFLAPSADVRQRARDVIGNDRYLEVHLAAPLDVCRRRDKSGIYAKADSGEIPEFPGVSAPYDEPQSPDLRLATDELSVEACVDQIVALLEKCGALGVMTLGFSRDRVPVYGVASARCASRLNGPDHSPSNSYHR